jgi:GntR family transcriptional repressor for pyruvate dehydrogenase complex
MKLIPVQKQRVYQSIVEQIKTSIERGELKPGDRLPSERDLAEALSVSRSAVREAITALESARLIRIMPGIGVFLEEDRNKDLIFRMNEIIVQRDSSLIELLEVRQALEGQAAYMAAMRHSESDLQAIREALQALEQSVDSGVIAAEEDFVFHLRIVEAAHNGMLLETVRLFSDKCRIGLYKSRSESMSIPGQRRAVLEEHRSIFAAIERRDAVQAQQMMWEHLQHVKARYL